MSKQSKFKRPRWNIRPVTANELDHLRRIHGFSGWDEFFEEVIQQMTVKTEKIPSLSQQLTDLRDRLEQVESKFSSFNESIEKLALELNEFATVLEDNTMMIRSIQDIISVSVNTEELAKKETKPHPLPALQKRLREIGA